MIIITACLQDVFQAGGPSPSLCVWRRWPQVTLDLSLKGGEGRGKEGGKEHSRQYEQQRQGSFGVLHANWCIQSSLYTSQPLPKYPDGRAVAGLGSEQRPGQREDLVQEVTFLPTLTHPDSRSHFPPGTSVSSSVKWEGWRECGQSI